MATQLIDPIASKFDRFATGKPLRVLDLFAGCGGISLGFQSAGFQIAGALEIDATAAATHALNFHRGDPIHAAPRDITAIEPADLFEELNLGPVDLGVDVIVGGPPCQAYARVGRAKLREIADHPEAFKVDPRGNLYLRYLHYVRQIKPLAILLENVPDALNYGKHNVIEEIAEALQDMGYDTQYSLINTAFHGVPQLRDRVFLVGLHKSVGADFVFPQATRHFKLPAGYEGTRAVALKHVGLFSRTYYEPADLGTPDLPGPVTAEEALHDLAVLVPHLTGELKRGARRFDTPAPYRPDVSPSAYARSMREWGGYLAPSDGPLDHVIRFLPRDTAIFREMPNGGEYPAAHATAVRLWEERVAEMERVAGSKLPLPQREALFKSMVPPYPVGSFPNRWWKLKPDWPSRTLLAHMGKDTYSHIHYDSRQARVISVREAARLQSFPDGFRFCGTMNPAYRQIGNAVPPLMAKALATQIRSALEAAAGQTQSLAAAQ